MKRMTAGILGLVLVTMMPSPAAAQRRVPLDGPVRAARPVPMRRAVVELGLTPLQRRQFQALRRDRGLQLRRLNREIMIRRGELAQLYRAYPLDEGKASSLIQQIAQLENQRLKLQLQNQVELRRILTRDQFGRFTTMMEERPGPALPPRVREPAR
jgi:Spy/CpxP family protein refolding chaperone